MLVDIFSCFDDMNQTFMEKSWMCWSICFFSVSILTTSLWEGSSRLTIFLNTLKSFMYSQVESTLGRKMGGFSIFLVTVFTFILVLNLSGMVPYIFSVTSHLVFSFSLSYPIWLALIVSSVIYNIKSFLASLLPSGTPSALSPFLILVETVSLSVRPLTLSLRLAANITAGHIFLGLIGSYTPSCGMTGGMLLMVILSVLYTLFEMGVCVVQAYIFCLLLSLYSDDHSL